MDKLIKVDRNRVIILLLFILLLNKSCKPIIDTTSKTFDIKFKSLYDDDRCTLVINGREYYNMESIKTERSLGIDLSKRITIKEDVINMKIQFESLIDAELDIQRKIELDTTLYLNDGYNIIISAGSDRVRIQQQSNIYELE